ncbi:MAG: phosphoserine phosphatase SerB [Clostridium sp.]|nr:phosphoserine phosphatase SerB [Clostridium sp.]
MKKLAVFDFDSTLMQGETIEIIADEAGLKNEVAAITKRAMEGELDFFDSLTQRVSLLKGIKESRVNEICQNLPYTKGAKETISELKKLGYIVVCFSGGFKNATEYAKKILGYDADFSNILHAKNGILTGHVGGPMMFSDSKGIMLEKLQSILGISQENTIAIGDGANDISMFRCSKEKIAFCAKPILKKAATVTIDENDLTNILQYC